MSRDLGEPWPVGEFLLSAIPVAAGEPLISWTPIVATVVWAAAVVAASAWRFRRDDAI